MQLELNKERIVGLRIMMMNLERTDYFCYMSSGKQVDFLGRSLCELWKE